MLPGRTIIRIVLGTAVLLSVPLLAMQFTDEVDWDVADFVVAGVLLGGTALLYSLATSRTSTIVYRAAVGVALAAALFLVWVNLAVGLIGSEDNPANLMYVGVLAVGFLGALRARFQAPGMARALLAAALAQVLVTVIALVGRLGAPWSGPAELLAVNGLFVALFAVSAWLFQRSEPRRVERRGT